MTTPRKRKSPKRKKKVQDAGLLSRLFKAAGRAVARHPRTLTGVTSFVIVFSFVAANALWYQPGNHPSPLLATRDTQDPNGIAGYRPARQPEPRDVTTFHIAREGQVSETILPQGDQASLQVPAATPTANVDRGMVAEIQRQLVRRGYYHGADDGLIGPQTTAAILAFEEAEGLPQTGEATSELLATLTADAEGGVQTAAVTPSVEVTGAVAVPVMRPAENVDASIADPVAAAIFASKDVEPQVATTSQSTADRDVSTDIVASTNLVFQIQRGLSNIAYTDIDVDGVAGAQTREAIRRFERHYRLPETGQPNELVLKKLKSIGAL